jgi:hypothetical protein
VALGNEKAPAAKPMPGLFAHLAKCTNDTPIVPLYGVLPINFIGDCTELADSDNNAPTITPKPAPILLLWVLGLMGDEIGIGGVEKGILFCCC